jgi:hypothetical protein
MHANRLFNVFVIGALAVMAAFTFRQVLATREVVVGHSDSATTLDGAPASAGLDALVRPRPYRASLDECFDVPLKDAAACQSHTQAFALPAAEPTSEYRLPSDECFDVPLKDAAACRAEPSGD